MSDSLARHDPLARRDLAIAAVVLVGLSRLLEPPAVWAVAAFLLGAVLLGTLQLLADEAPPAEAAIGVPVECLILPAVAAAACLGAIRLVPFGLWLVPALLVTWLLVGRTLSLEARVYTRAESLTAEDRTSILVTTLLVGFLGFVGVAAMVPGGLVQPGSSSTTLPEANLVVLAAGDALVAFLLGYRAAALRVTTVRDALTSAVTYAIAIAIAAAALRAMEIPRLIGPALLTLVFYLWDAFAGASPTRRRERRWMWQTGLLAVLGVAVVAWNLLLRG